MMIPLTYGQTPRPGSSGQIRRRQPPHARMRGMPLCILAVLAVLAFGRCPARAADWAVPRAAVRVRATITGVPEPASAGCELRVPDGGMLPSPGPYLVAVDEAGNRLKIALLWHDPRDHALVIVAAPPKGKTVEIYAGHAPRARGWSPAGGLTPGTFAVTTRSADDLDARAIARRLPLGTGTVCARLSEPALGGHPTAQPGAFAAYVLTHLICTDPGRMWIAPMGPVEAVIDGTTLQPKAASDKPGGSGSELLLAKGTHRLELFHQNSGSREDAFRIAWRPPNTPAKELEPDRDGDPQWAARPVRKSECARSGTAKVVAIERRDGGPAAAFKARPRHYLLFREDPIVLYEFRHAYAAGDGKTDLHWTLPDGSTVAGTNCVQWLVEATGRREARLHARRNGLRGQCTRAFDPSRPGARRATIMSARDRTRFRATVTAMLRATPGGADQIRTWSPTFWDTVLRLFVPGEGEPLLKHLMVDWPDAVTAGISRGHLEKLEGLYFTAACPTHPKTVLQWIDARLAVASEPARIAMWHLRRAEVNMYYLDNPDAVHADLAAAHRGGGNIAMWARIRQGDLALLQGKPDTAMALYARIQDDVRHGDVVKPETPASKPSHPEPGLARSRADMRTKRRNPRRGRTPDVSDEESVDDWRIGAIRRTSLSETARHLVRKGRYEDAMSLLAKWEMEFPVSKLSGDYLVVEAMLRVAIGDAHRATRTLGAYCKAVDLTNYLPEAMKLRIVAMKELGADKSELRAFADDMKRRFPDHPIVSQAESLL